MLWSCYVRTMFIYLHQYLQGSGRALSGGSPALTTSAKPCSQCSSASPLRGGQICSIGSVAALNDVKRSVLLHLCLPDPRLTGEYLAVHLLCVHGRPRSLLRNEPHSRCSQRVNIHSSSLAFFFVFSTNIHAWSFSYQAHLLIFSESSLKRRRKPNLEATSSACEQNSKWRKTYKATSTGSHKPRSWRLTRKPMPSR